VDDNNNNNILGLGNITFTAQNCQSLNISTKNGKTLKKILAMVKGGEDVIFLSDLRLNSELQKHAIHDLEKKYSIFSTNSGTIVKPRPEERAP
jgi:hypothetical protein